MGSLRPEIISRIRVICRIKDWEKLICILQNPLHQQPHYFLDNLSLEGMVRDRLALVKFYGSSKTTPWMNQCFWLPKFAMQQFIVACLVLGEFSLTCWNLDGLGLQFLDFLSIMIQWWMGRPFWSRSPQPFWLHGSTAVAAGWGWGVDGFAHTTLIPHVQMKLCPLAQCLSPAQKLGDPVVKIILNMIHIFKHPETEMGCLIVWTNGKFK